MVNDRRIDTGSNPRRRHFTSSIIMDMESTNDNTPNLFNYHFVNPSTDLELFTINNNKYYRTRMVKDIHLKKKCVLFCFVPFDSHSVNPDLSGPSQGPSRRVVDLLNFV